MTPSSNFQRPGDDIRRVAQLSLAATTQLEAALDAGDIDKARSALEAGALPALAQFRDKKGKPTSAAVARALKHPRFDLAMLQLLLEYEAPLPLSAPGAALRAALEAQRIDALPLLVRRVKPRPADWMHALRQPLATFRALDDLIRMDRRKNIGTFSFTGHPPLFLVLDPELMRYLVETGADPLQTPGLHPKNHNAQWSTRSVVTHYLMSPREAGWARNPDLLLCNVRYLHGCGVPLTPTDLDLAVGSGHFELVRYFIDQGHRLDSFPQTELGDRLRAYQTAVELEYNTVQSGTATGSRRL